MELLLPDYGLIAWSSFLLLCIVTVWVLAPRHLLKSNTSDGSLKVTWGIIICLFPLFGGLLYLSLGRKGIIKLNQRS